jgi:hypothetical protein
VRKNQFFELTVAGLFCLAFALVPLFRVELFPFSRAPMFADAPQLYCRYSVSDEQGRPLSAEEFGLQCNYWGNPVGEGVGFLPPPSIDVFGAIVDRPKVTEFVQKKLNEFPHLRVVAIRREVIGPLAGGGVGIVKDERWTIVNETSGIAKDQ